MDREDFILEVDTIAQHAAPDGYSQNYVEREAGILFEKIQKAEHNTAYAKCLCEDCKNKECEGWEGKVTPEDFVVRKCKGHCI